MVLFVREFVRLFVRLLDRSAFRLFVHPLADAAWKAPTTDFGFIAPPLILEYLGNANQAAHMLSRKF